ncbi:MAG TPA: response regulator [Candidatus Limnocylindrales bacterium]|nr:response regulator [Candidatus Limnocylindrales bacterium]
MIKVLIVDDIAETRDHLTKLLAFEQTVEVAGVASSGEEAIQVAMDLRPDVVVMDINMPGLDGIAAAELITQRLPTAAIIMMSVHGEAEQLRRSLQAGAREFLVKPFSSDEFSETIKRVYEREEARRHQIQAAMPAAPAAATREPEVEHQVIAMFSAKGGSGRTTIATNVAIAIRQQTGTSVAILDANLQFGDVGVLLNLNPKTRSIVDVADGPEPDADLIESVTIEHSSGIRALLAPPTPESADLISPTFLKAVVGHLRAQHAYTVVDLPAGINDHSLAVMDTADQIVVMAALEITSIKNLRLFLEVADQLGYERGKLRIVMNRADATQGIRMGDVEASIRRPIDGTIVSDGRLAVLSVNRGVPFVLSSPESPLSRDVNRLAQVLIGGTTPAAEEKPNRRGIFARR